MLTFFPAQGLSAFQPETVAFSAGRIMVNRIHQLAKECKSFAFETTLASRTYAPWIKKIQQAGLYRSFNFSVVASPEFAIARVQERVRTGGHNVPEGVIRRRYHAGIRNFFQLYRP